MPWKEVEPMEEKQRFIALSQTGHYTITELCAQFGIRRKTGHKYLRRYAEEGQVGLHERSRRPQHIARVTDKQVEGLILKERRRRRHRGPKKIRIALVKRYGIKHPPAESTIGLILQRHGMTQKPKRRSGVYRVRPEHLTQPSYPNEVWTIDFKGWFVLGNGQCCHPLTTCDLFSHFVLSCHACAHQQFNGTLRLNKGLMRHHGLPEVMRVDNGTPFASHALGGLSRLSVWWIEQGIRVEFIAPASPQQNGAHERMHRVLKQEACKPPSVNLSAQHKRFQRWKYVYNYDRPHESLDMRTPGDIYHPSQRRLGENDKMAYPEDFLVKKVTQTGVITHGGANFYLGDIFAGCRVGLFQNPDGITELHYANLHLGNLCYDGTDPFRPPAYITRPHHKLSTKQTSKNKHNKV